MSPYLVKVWDEIKCSWPCFYLSLLLFSEFLETFADVANIDIGKWANKGKVDWTRREFLWPDKVFDENYNCAFIMNPPHWPPEKRYENNEDDCPNQLVQHRDQAGSSRIIGKRRNQIDIDRAFRKLGDSNSLNKRNVQVQAFNSGVLTRLS